MDGYNGTCPECGELVECAAGTVRPHPAPDGGATNRVGQCSGTWRKTVETADYFRSVRMTAADRRTARRLFG